MFRQSLRILQRQSTRLAHELKRRELCSSSSNKFLCVPKKKVLPFQHFEQVSSLHLSSECYAKNRDKKKEKKKPARYDENELNEYFDIEVLMSDITKPLEIFKDELIKHTTLRSSAGAIENLTVEFEGGEYMLQDLAQIGRKNPRLVVLDFAAFPKAIPAVMTAFQTSELNINPQQEGTKVFVPIPKVTKDHREVLAKKCKLYFNKCKEGIRDIQMKYVKKLGSIEKLPTEDKFRLTDYLTALGDKQIQKAEEMMKTKQEELMDANKMMDEA